jgi:hypothetical protein
LSKSPDICGCPPPRGAQMPAWARRRPGRNLHRPAPHRHEVPRRCACVRSRMGPLARRHRLTQAMYLRLAPGRLAASLPCRAVLSRLSGGHAGRPESTRSSSSRGIHEGEWHLGLGFPTYGCRFAHRKSLATARALSSFHVDLGTRLGRASRTGSREGYNI